MQLINSLPEDVLVEILRVWLASRDFCFLDTAICVKSTRTSILELIGKSNIVLNGDSGGDSFVPYLELRNLGFDKYSTGFETANKRILESTKLMCIIQHLYCLVRSPHDFGPVMYTLRSEVPYFKNVRELKIVQGSRGKEFDTELVVLLVRNCPALEKITFRNILQIPVDALHTLVDLKSQLISLTVLGCSYFPSELLKELLIKHEKTLEIIDFSGCQFLSDVHIDIIAQYGKNFKKLNIERNRTSKHDFSPTVLYKIATNCTHLLRLDISAHTIPSDFFASLCSENTELEELRMDNCTDVSASDVIILIQKCTNLRILSLDNTAVITDELLRSVGLNSFLLEELSMASKDATISDNELLVIAQNCSHLRYLRLPDCITDTTIQIISPYLNALTFLNMKENNHITDISLDYLLISCPVLQKLKVLKCTKLTTEATAVFVDSRQNVKCDAKHSVGCVVN